MKINAKEERPKIHFLVILTIIAAALILYLIFWAREAHPIAVCSIAIAYFSAVVISLVAAFFRQIRFNLYSYNTVFYIGFALFMLSVVLTFVMVLQWLLQDPTLFGPDFVLYILSDSAKNYMVISFPFILLFSGGLCISNIALIRHEGKRFVNIIGIILSVLMLGGAVLLYALTFYVTGSAQQVMIHDLLTNIYASVYLYFECMLIGTIVAGMIAALYKPEPDKDFLIILGCGIRKDGTPTPILRSRIDLALDFYRKQKETTGKELTFVTSGGQGPREVTTESSAMKRYLIEQGIPETQIIEEDRSTSTYENMMYSKEKIFEIDPKAKIAFATSNYHVFRSGILSRRAKMRTVGMGARTKWYFWPNAAVREFVGLVASRKGKQGMILGSIIVIYSFLTFLSYR